MFAILTILPVLAHFGTALVPALGVPLTLATAKTENLTEAMANPTIRRAFTNSLMLSGGAAVIAGVLALALAFFAVVLQGRPARMLDLVADAPFVVPGTVLGIAMILVYLRPLPGIGMSIYNISMILALAYLGRFLPLVLRPVGAAMAALDPSLDEAGRIAGIGCGARLARIFLPAVAPAKAAGAILVFLKAFHELTVSALLRSSGSETVGVMIFSLQCEGNSTGAAALSVLSLNCAGILVALQDRVGRRLPSGTSPWRNVA